MTRAAFAEGFVARGWHVFPCKVGAKEPATRSGLYAATDDLVTARRWWRTTDYNIGINCGASGLLVVDLDVNPERGDAGIAFFCQFAVLNGFDFEDTYCVVTPKGGLHAYYATDLPLRTSTSELAPNIDTRGLGGYVVAAGSVVGDTEYEACCGSEPLPIPEALATLFRPKPPPTPEQIDEQARYDLRGDADARERAIRGLISTVQTALEGERNNTLNWAAVQVARKFWDDATKEEAWDRLIVTGTYIGLTERECRDTINSARRASR